VDDFIHADAALSSVAKSLAGQLENHPAENM
jgi:hypothetical protein